MKQQKILRSYSRKRDGDLGEFALGVGGKTKANPIFKNLTITGDQVIAKATEFNTSVGNCVGGTETDTAHKKAVRAQLISLLDNLADEVEDLAQGNVEILTASGFQLTNPAGPSPAPVGTVSIQNLINVASGKLGLNLIVTGNVWTVIVERQNADTTWAKVAVFTDLNDTVVTGIVPGSTNTFRVCCMAAANQTSEWSTPITGICT